MHLALLAAGAIAAGLAGVWLVTRERITIADPDRPELGPLLHRWVLFGKRPSKSRRRGYAVYLHRICRPDADRCHHDHPWSFWTFVLWGGYWEEVTPARDDHLPFCWVRKVAPNSAVPPQCSCGARVRLFIAPGTLHFRPATYTHCIASLPRGCAWTLVLRGPDEREWGFHTSDGWKPFRAMRGMFAEWCR